jgi:two-component system nitrate/nitrite response regulator NarL
VVQDLKGSEKIRVVIQHDVRVVRDGIASLLGQSPGLAVVGLPRPETGSQEKQEGGGADVVLAVSELAAGATADQIQKIKDTFPDAKVVVIGVLGTEKESLEYIEAGASGYVLPESCPEDLVETIQIVHRGEASCPPGMLASLFERIASLHTQLKIAQNIELSTLTHRELKILQLVADGMSNKEIAICLKLELQTVKNHVHNILEKLRVRNRRDAVACTRKVKKVVESNQKLPISAPF